MAANSHFAAPSLSMAVSVRVEVFDSRESASKRSAKPMAKFRMRTPASTTFETLGASVAERYLKESAGTIKTLPRVVCIVDKEDCTFDVDDNIDAIIPNEAIRIVLDRTPQQQQHQHQHHESPPTQVSAPQPVSGPRIASRAAPTSPTRQLGHAASSDVTTEASAQFQIHPPLSAGRKPALLSQRQGILSNAGTKAQVAPTKAKPSTASLVITPNARSTVPITSSGCQHKDTRDAQAQSVTSASRKRDPYDIDSDSDANDPPSHGTSWVSTRKQGGAMVAGGRGRTPSSYRRPDKVVNAPDSAERAATLASVSASHTSQPLLPSAVFRPSENYNDSPRGPVANQVSNALSQAQLQNDGEGPRSTTICHTDQPTGPHTESTASGMRLRSSVILQHAEVASVADSMSDGENSLVERTRATAEPSLRSLQKRAYHTVNEHIEIVDGPDNPDRQTLPTPILLKNSKGVFPVYRKGEAPSLASEGASGTETRSSNVMNATKHVLTQSSPGMPTRSNSASHRATATGEAPKVTKPLSTIPVIDIETEFAGFEELSDFEIRPTARPIMSEPHHRTRTPSRSSMKQPRTVANTHEFQSSNHPRSSPLESKQRRLSLSRRTKQAPSPRRTALSPPKRGTNNRASREHFGDAAKKATPKTITKPAASKPVNPPSSASSGISGDTIRRWLASRKPKSPVVPPAKEPPSTVRPVMAQAAVRQLKSMAE
ncbi:uncharacterized protein B0I36DRAFT_432561, partial [Microdochium trichocladiopsis]